MFTSKSREAFRKCHNWNVGDVTTDHEGTYVMRIACARHPLGMAVLDAQSTSSRITQRNIGDTLLCGTCSYSDQQLERSVTLEISEDGRIIEHITYE